jgi:acid phosphatase type 7
LLAALPGFAFSCDTGGRAAPSVPSAIAVKPDTVSLVNPVVMLAAGDIAVCGTSGDEATAMIVDSVLKADSVAKINDVVVTMGDNAYPSGPQGDLNTFQRCFAPSWGTSRIMKVIRPSPGNHDLETQGGPSYYAYFGDRAGPAGKGYYSYDIGEWHIISLNSEILDDRSLIPQVRAQEDWLRNDLKSHRKQCMLAYFHRPLFSSGDFHGSSPEVRGLWYILYDGGVDVILNGHEHHYERFLPQTPLGAPDSVKGIVEIISGTGGGDLRGVRSSPVLNSAAHVHGHFGVLELTLGKGAYRHEFIDTDGTIWDRGTSSCH